MTATSQQQNKLKTNNNNSNINSSSSGCSSVCSTSSKIKPISIKRKHLLDIRKNQYFFDKSAINIMCNNNDSLKAKTLLPSIKNRFKYTKNSKQIFNYDEGNDDFEEKEDEISQYHFCQFDASQFGQTLYRQHHDHQDYVISKCELNKQKATLSEKDKRYLLLKLALPVPPPVVPLTNFDRSATTIPSTVAGNNDQGSYLSTVPNSTKNSFHANSTTIKDDGTVDILTAARPIVPPPPPPPPPRRGTRLHVLAHAHAQRSGQQQNSSVDIDTELEHEKTTSGTKEGADIGENRVCLDSKERFAQIGEVDNHKFSNNKHLTTNQTQEKKKKIKIKRKTNNIKPRRKQEEVILLSDTKCDDKNYYNDDKCQVDIRASLSGLFNKKRENTREFVNINEQRCQNWSTFEQKGKQKVNSSESRRQFGKQNTLCSQVHGLNLICQSNIDSSFGSCQRCSSLDKISTPEIYERKCRQVDKNLCLSVSSCELDLGTLTTKKRTLMTGVEDESKIEEYQYKQSQNNAPIYSNNDDKHYMKTTNQVNKDCVKNSIVSFEKVTYLTKDKKKIEKTIRKEEKEKTNQKDLQIPSFKGNPTCSEISLSSSQHPLDADSFRDSMLEMGVAQSNTSEHRNKQANNNKHHHQACSGALKARDALCKQLNDYQLLASAAVAVARSKRRSSATESRLLMQHQPLACCDKISSKFKSTERVSSSAVIVTNNTSNGSKQIPQIVSLASVAAEVAAAASKRHQLRKSSSPANVDCSENVKMLKEQQENKTQEESEDINIARDASNEAKNDVSSSSITATTNSSNNNNNSNSDNIKEDGKELEANKEEEKVRKVYKISIATASIDSTSNVLRLSLPKTLDTSLVSSAINQQQQQQQECVSNELSSVSLSRPESPLSELKTNTEDSVELLSSRETITRKEDDTTTDQQSILDLPKYFQVSLTNHQDLVGAGVSSATSNHVDLATNKPSFVNTCKKDLNETTIENDKRRKLEVDQQTAIKSFCSTVAANVTAISIGSPVLQQEESFDLNLQKLIPPLLELQQQNETNKNNNCLTKTNSSSSLMLPLIKKTNSECKESIFTIKNNINNNNNSQVKTTTLVDNCFNLKSSNNQTNIRTSDLGNNMYNDFNVVNKQPQRQLEQSQLTCKLNVGDSIKITRKSIQLKDANCFVKRVSGDKHNSTIIPVIAASSSAIALATNNNGLDTTSIINNRKYVDTIECLSSSSSDKTKTSTTLLSCQMPVDTCQVDNNQAVTILPTIETGIASVTSSATQIDETSTTGIFDGASKDEILEYLEDARGRVPEVLMAADEVMVIGENELIVVNQLEPGAPATPISIEELESEQAPLVSSVLIAAPETSTLIEGSKHEAKQDIENLETIPVPMPGDNSITTILNLSINQQPIIDELSKHLNVDIQTLSETKTNSLFQTDDRSMWKSDINDIAPIIRSPQQRSASVQGTSSTCSNYEKEPLGLSSSSSSSSSSTRSTTSSEILSSSTTNQTSATSGRGSSTCNDESTSVAFINDSKYTINAGITEKLDNNNNNNNDSRNFTKDTSFDFSSSTVQQQSNICVERDDSGLGMDLICSFASNPVTRTTFDNNNNNINLSVARNVANISGNIQLESQTATKSPVVGGNCKDFQYNDVNESKNELNLNASLETKAWLANCDLNLHDSSDISKANWLEENYVLNPSSIIEANNSSLSLNSQTGSELMVGLSCEPKLVNLAGIEINGSDEVKLEVKNDDILNQFEENKQKDISKLSIQPETAVNLVIDGNNNNNTKFSQQQQKSIGLVKQNYPSRRHFGSLEFEFRCVDCDRAIAHSEMLASNILDNNNNNNNSDFKDKNSTTASEISKDSINILSSEADFLNKLKYRSRHLSAAEKLDRTIVHSLNNLPLCDTCKKRRVERREIVSEFIETELKYGRDLRIIQDEFRKPMQIAGLLSKDQINGIFLNLEELISINNKFAQILTIAQTEAQELGDFNYNSIRIGKIFNDHADMLSIFETYCIRQGSAACLLARLAKEKELLRIFLRVSQMENALLRRMNLAAFLVVPVQRITRYPLLLSRLYKVTAFHHKDREALREALMRVELHLEHINQQTRGFGATNKIWRRISLLSSSSSSSTSSTGSSACAVTVTSSNSNFGSSLRVDTCSNCINKTNRIASDTNTTYDTNSPCSCNNNATTSTTNNNSQAQHQVDSISYIKLRKTALDLLKWNKDETQIIHTGKLSYVQLNEHLVKNKTRSLRYTEAHALLVINGKPNWRYRPDLVKAIAPSNHNSDNAKLMNQSLESTGIRQAALVLIREKHNKAFVACREPLLLSNCVLSADCSQYNIDWQQQQQQIAASSSINSSQQHSPSSSSSSLSSSAAASPLSNGDISDQKTKSNGDHRLIKPVANAKIVSTSPKSTAITAPADKISTNTSRQTNKTTEPRLSISHGLTSLLWHKSAPTGMLKATHNLHQHNAQARSTSEPNSVNPPTQSMVQKSLVAKQIPRSAAITIVGSETMNISNNNNSTTTTTTNQNSNQSTTTSSSHQPIFTYHNHYHTHNFNTHLHNFDEESFEIHEHHSKESMLLRAETPLKTKYWFQILRYHAKDLGTWRARRKGLANIMMVMQRKE